MPPMPNNAETRTVKAIADGLAKSEFSSREITDLCLKQTEQVDSIIKAYKVVAAENAVAAAEASDDRRRNGRALGPFDGVPYVAKDIVEVNGIETTGSSNVLKGNIPNRTASTVERLNAAGGVLLGKVNTHQFAYGVETPPTPQPLGHGDRPRPRRLQRRHRCRRRLRTGSLRPRHGHRRLHPHPRLPQRHHRPQGHFRPRPQGRRLHALLVARPHRAHVLDR